MTVFQTQWEEFLEALNSGDEARAEALVPELAREAEVALAFLWEQLTHPDELHRWAALRLLAALSSPPVEWFVWSLADAAETVRAAAALALVWHPHPRALPALIEALADPNSLTADLAMQALIAQGKEAVPALLQAASLLPPAAHLRATRALASLADARAIPYLLQTIEEGSSLAAYWAEQGLERLGQNLVYFMPGK